jgi:hypothetical protein
MGAFTLYPRFLVRENMVEANPIIAPSSSGTTLSPGIDPRNQDDDPFAVLGNRKAVSREVILTYDPTPGTWFYAWNADTVEDAPFAFNLGLTVTDYDTSTDSERYYYAAGGTNSPFGEGLASEEVYLLKSKIFLNSADWGKYVFDLEAGKQQSTGVPGKKAVEFTSVSGKAVFGGRHIVSAYVKQDAFGPYDFHRQFNITFPLQAKLEYALLLDQFQAEDKSGKIGIKMLYRTLDENSPADEYEDGKNTAMFENQLYFNYRF